jgi:two-component system, cell cycle sensor histidine kinase and response regulator CckA
MVGSRNGRESGHLWFAIWIILALSAYRLTTQCIIPLQRFFEQHTSVPMADILSNGLFFWLLLLLWLAYRRWRDSLYRQHELERVIASISPDVLIVIGEDRTIVMCNGAIKAMFGYTEDEVVGQKTDLLYFDRRVTGEKHEIFKYLQKVGFHVGNATGRRRDGTTFPLEIITGNISDSDGVVALVRDITERRNVETALRESEERFALFMRHLPAGASIKGPDGKHLYINEYFQEAFGWELPQCAGMKDEDLFPRALAKALAEQDAVSISEGHVVQGAHEIPLRGETHTFEIYRFPILRRNQPPLLGGIFVDRTKQRRAEEEHRRLEIQMLQSQKLESLGLLGGGIAHDFNNLLAGILGYADLALNELPETSPAAKSISEVVDASKRAADLCNQLLAYSGEGKFVVEAVDISALVREMSHLLEVTISKKAKLKCHLAKALPAVECDATQVRQVVMNLIVNASDAMADQAGRITVSTFVRKCDREYLSKTYLGESLSEGEYVSIEVTDTGCGMDEATKARIFDPFFSTKFTGRGLGLAAVMGIVRGHRGAIMVDSQTGKGTSFTVLLPASDKAYTKGVAVPRDEDDWMGSGTVLVADDEGVIRSVAATMLEKIGFSVVTARDGREAVDVFREHADEICGLLLDLTMPALGGVEAYNEMKKAGLKVPVIFSSGYNKKAEIKLLVGDEKLGFLQKPYQLTSVRREFRRLLQDEGEEPLSDAT